MLSSDLLICYLDSRRGVTTIPHRQRARDAPCVERARSVDEIPPCTHPLSTCAESFAHEKWLNRHKIYYSSTLGLCSLVSDLLLSFVVQSQAFVSKSIQHGGESWRRLSSRSTTRHAHQHACGPRAPIRRRRPAAPVLRSTTWCDLFRVPTCTHYINHKKI